MLSRKILLDELDKHRNLIKIAAIIGIMIVAFVFFGPKGEKDEIVVEREGVDTSQIDDVEEPSLIDRNMVYVDISGEVKRPGVYEVEANSRLFQVIEMAGGLKRTADVNAFNQAEIVADGAKILIPKKGEYGQSFLTGEDSHQQGKININQADSIKLQEIPGVGPATADKIIDYRNSNGYFKSIEDIKSVSGIGEKTFEKMKDMITV